MTSYQKYSGAGNDFLMVNNLSGEFKNLSALTVELISLENKNSDGVIFVEDSDIADYKMNYYNRDGTGNALCGNGLRCTAKYLRDNAICKKNIFTLEAINKIYQAEFLSKDTISISFPPPKKMKFGFPLKVNFFEWWQDVRASYIDVDSLHCVIFLDDIENLNISLEEIDINEWGRNVRMHHDFMPEGVNANFAEIRSGEIFLRSYEKGVEGETLACGTGAICTAIAAYSLKGLIPPYKIHTQSGDILTVHFEINNSQISGLTLAGPAIKIS